MFREFDFLDNELEDEFNWGLGRRRRSLSGLGHHHHHAYPTTMTSAAADLAGRPMLQHHEAMLHGGGGAYPGSVPNLVTGQHLEEAVDGAAAVEASIGAAGNETMEGSGAAIRVTGSVSGNEGGGGKMDTLPALIPRDSSSVSKVGVSFVNLISC